MGYRKATDSIQTLNNKHPKRVTQLRTNLHTWLQRQYSQNLAVFASNKSGNTWHHENQQEFLGEDYSPATIARITAEVRMVAPTTLNNIVERVCSASAPPQIFAASQANATPQSPRNA